MKTARYTLLSIIFLIVIIALPGCPEKDNPAGNDPGDETILETKSVTLNSSGGIITLSDSSSVEVPSNAVQSATLTVKRIANDTYMKGDNKVFLDITIDNIPSKIIIKFKLPTDMEKEQIGIIAYNPEDVTDSLVGITPDFNYDKTSGIATVEYMPSKTKPKFDSPQGKPLPSRWVAEYYDDYEGKSETYIIEMPFYEQPGKSCWATCAVMLSKGYTPYKNLYNEVEVYNYLKYLSIERDDGIRCYRFLRSLPNAFNFFTGAGVETEGYFRTGALTSKIIKELDKSHPIIMALPYPKLTPEPGETPWIQHAIMIIGYKKKTDIYNNTTYELIYHNPQGTGNESMYCSQTPENLFKCKSSVVAVQILYPKEEPHPNRTLLTLGMPLGLVGKVQFKVPYKTSAYYINLDWDLQSTKGYSWLRGVNIMESVPDTATELIIRLPIWNADRFNTKNAFLHTYIYKADNNPTNVYTKTDNFSIPISTDPYWYDLTIPIGEFRQNSGKKEYSMEFRLYNGSDYADAFEVHFNMEPLNISLNGDWSVELKDAVDPCGLTWENTQSTYTFKIINNTTVEVTDHLYNIPNNYTLVLNGNKFKMSNYNNTHIIEGSFSGKSQWVGTIKLKYSADCTVTYQATGSMVK